MNPMNRIKGFYHYFQKELPSKHETDHDGFLNRAFAVKYNARKMKKLEKDFTVIKKEEQEEQVEIRRLRAENKLLKQRIENLEKESANLADRLIKGQVVNAQSAESIYILKNENQKLKDKIAELQTNYEAATELRRKQLSDQSNTTNEREILHEKVNMLLEENSKLRETPDNQRMEEELVQVKMREAEGQLAIKELQKTIHVLNLEYQQFMNNRSAALLSLNATSAMVNSTNSTNSTSSPNTSNSSFSNLNGPSAISRSDFEALEEELLKVKMREAEEVSELKSTNLKLMQFETEKQVAYKQIKRQDEEIRKLNQQIARMSEQDLEMKSLLKENRRQLDDKDARLKELNMTHRLQEAEDAHVIAELRQRVASLEVQIQELVTTGQLNYNEKANFDIYRSNNGLNSTSASTDKLADFQDDMKYMLLMSSTASLLNDKESGNGGKQHSFSLKTKSIAEKTPPTTLMEPVKTLNKNGVSSSASSYSPPEFSSSTSLTSLPNSTSANAASSTHPLVNKLNLSLNEPATSRAKNFKTLNRSQSSDETELITEINTNVFRETGANYMIKENSLDQVNGIGEDGENDAAGED